MAKKKQDELTTRQLQSRKIMREKAARKRRQAWTQRLLVAGLALLAVTVLGGGSWLMLSGAGARAWTQTVDGAYAITARAGLSVQSIYLEGRNRTAMQEINAALGIRQGDPILRISLDEARRRLEKIESVRFAAVERALPDALYIRVIEREPVALWQHQGKLAPVDDNGVVMHGIEAEPYKHLPLIVGDGAPGRIGELMELLAAEPDLTKDFAAALRMGDRRWNIRLSNGTEILLPENDALAAWKKLAELQASQKLLDRAVKIVDLRVEGRLFITVAPADMPRRATGAKET